MTAVSGNPVLWGIHSMDDSLFLNQGLIALGWEEMENLSSLPQSREAFKERYMKFFPVRKRELSPIVLGCFTGLCGR